jgi:undecaprenyl-diphosphatase
MTTDSLERRGPEANQTRGRLHVAWDAIFAVVRLIARYAHGVYTTFGIFIIAGTAIALLGTYWFAELAGHMRRGATQHFDESVLRWLAAHRTPALDSSMLEITALGTGSVVVMTVLIAAVFLWLTRHKHSAVLLGVASIGGMLLNGLLKLGFNRPRPTVVSWGATTFSSSFPSGHSMNAVIVYGTVAYLIARLQQRRAVRIATLVVAAIVIALVCGSRLYLGVHYPSDVAAGLVIGLAWAAFCMATLEAIQLYARRHVPKVLEQEKPAAAPG